MERIGKILKRDLMLKLVALFFALIIWIYVMGEVNPMREKSFQNIPVTVTNAQFIDNNTLMVTNDEAWNRQLADLRVTISVPRNQYDAVGYESLGATLDLSVVQAPGSYSIPVNVSVPTNVTLSAVSPTDVTLEVDEVSTLEIPVVVQQTGTLPDGYYAKKPVLSAQTIELTGAKTDLERIVQAACTIDLNNLTSSVNVAKTLTLLDENGNAVEDAKLRVAVPSVIVRMDVLPMVGIDVDQEAALTGQLGSGLVLTSSTFEPETVRVAAEQDVLSSMTSLPIAEAIDLASLTAGTWTQQLTVELPEGAINVDNVEKVTVTLVVDKAPTATTTDS